MSRRLAVAFATLSAVVAISACVPKAATLPAVGAPAPQATAPSPSGWQVDMLAQVNAQRAANGAGPVAICNSLTRAAQAHSADQAAHNSMSHVGSDGATLVDRIARAGYGGWTALGENVAYGYGDVASVMNGWMNSPGHRANIVNPAYTHIGLGEANASNGTPYWTQDFGRSGTC